jgi:hypothetical protein
MLMQRDARVKSTDVHRARANVHVTVLAVASFQISKTYTPDKNLRLL